MQTTLQRTMISRELLMAFWAIEKMFPFDLSPELRAQLLALATKGDLAVDDGALRELLFEPKTRCFCWTEQEGNFQLDIGQVVCNVFQSSWPTGCKKETAMIEWTIHGLYGESRIKVEVQPTGAMNVSNVLVHKNYADISAEFGREAKIVLEWLAKQKILPWTLRIALALFQMELNEAEKQDLCQLWRTHFCNPEPTLVPIAYTNGLRAIFAGVTVAPH